MTEQKERPTFLTVLCILSFIGIAFGLFGSLKILSDTEKHIYETEQAQLLIEEMGASNGFLGELSQMGQMHPELLENLSAITIIQLLITLGILVGVIMMWKLKRTGFFIYSGLKVVSLLIPVAFAGFGYQTGVAWLIGIFFAFLFILLYSINLKAMS